MSGLEEIVEKIIKDARKKANSTSEEASIKASETIGGANNDAHIFIQRNMQESYAEREDIIKRRVSAAILESKKMLLKTKQEILSEAFSGAVKEIKGDLSRYKKLIISMLQSAEDGDVVVISQEDKDTISPEFIKGILAKKPVKATVSENYGAFLGGIVLKGKKMDKNMSLEVELASARDEKEPEIVETLFTEKE